jgi:hypothetical protein
VDILLWAAIALLFWGGIYNLRLITELSGELRKHQYDHIYKRATETEVETIVHNTRPIKAKIFSPAGDPMSEFNGKRDDWYGDENAR